MIYNHQINELIIYIPIWIDLKVSKQSGKNSYTAIYIPIWIDLKAMRCMRYKPNKTDLHSNMDRFERDCHTIVTMRSKNLHSNMDRFESYSPMRYKEYVLHLHSNMDRFESD